MRARLQYAISTYIYVSRSVRFVVLYGQSKDSNDCEQRKESQIDNDRETEHPDELQKEKLQMK